MARETPSILPISEALIPLPLSSLARAAAASSILRGLPPWRLLAAAAARPALVRSIIVAFQLGERGHNRQHGGTHGPCRIQTFGEGTETCSSFPDILDDVQDVPRVASQAIELPHREYITGFQPVEGFGKLRTFLRGSADAIVGKGPGCAGGPECRELQIKVLFRGGYPRVPDHSHSRLAILLIPNNSPL